MKGMRILIVEDIPSIRDLVARLLQSLGCRDVHEAEDLTSARKKLDQFGYDAVLLDYELSGENGLRLLRGLRKQTWHFNRDVPVIVLTGHAGAELIESAVAAGANAYLVKPVMPDRLGQRILDVRQKTGWTRPAVGSVPSEPDSDDIEWID
nr:response regulator [Maricaulis parjimensis]